ncbi:sulfotransferase [Flavobacteriales bacterium]|nr:sulfotransferase [Flavobacteriales bacterium]
MLPNFLIIGASKCGTTALYYYLTQHPEISFPKLKEPKYFSSINTVFPHNGIGDISVDKYAIKSLEDYKILFSNINNKRVGEASPDTIYFHNTTTHQIKEDLGDIPIIIMLREPVRRAFSAFMYLKRDSREKLNFREGLLAESERLDNNWDFIWGYKKCGIYYDQVKAFMDNFSNVKVILAEDLRKETSLVLKDIYSFLDVDATFKSDISIIHNESGIPNNPVSKFLLSRNNIISTAIREIMKKLIPRQILEKIASKSLDRVKILDEDARSLKPYFHDDICKLEKLIKKDLSSWK